MQSKARTYAQVMVQLFDGASEVEAKKRARQLKHVLQKRGETKHLGEIFREFTRAWKERKGRLATVVSAEPLSGGVKSDIEKALGKQGYVVEEKTDPGVIGGVALFLRNEFVIDATIRGKLKRLATRIKF